MLNAGDRVVHPQHGLGTVEEIKETEVLGETVRVYVIKTKKMDLQIPVDNADDLGIRPIVDADDADILLKILRAPAKEEPFTATEGWQARYDALKRRIREGTADDLAEIVRDLDKNSKIYELNIREREVLTLARDLLIQELTVALDLPKSQVTKKVNEALKANVKKRAAR